MPFPVCAGMTSGQHEYEQLFFVLFWGCCCFLPMPVMPPVSPVSTANGVTFRTNFTLPPDDILWKHNGNKVVQFDGNEQTEYNPFQKRITLDWHSADLEINQLTHSDSGQYQLDAAKKDGLNRLNFELKVLGNEATLMCSWSQPGKIQSGQILTISLGTEHDDKVYSCTASNQLSKEIATFTAKDCYPGKVLLISSTICL
uniref:Ig-like domain-containing protein n=1 Tax=Pundamilia nyererei TaxID=303518 RepID=A0A3B4HCK0_9CICH